MALKVEDGSLVAGANSYSSVFDADEYCLPRQLWPETPIEINEDDTVVADLSAVAKKEAALIRAFDWLNGLDWKGEPLSVEQIAAWPRKGVKIGGNELDANAMPRAVKLAQIEMAALFYNGFNPFEPKERGGKAASISTSESGGLEGLSESKSHSATYSEDAPVETLFPAVVGYLRLFLKSVPGETLKCQMIEAGRG